MNKIETDAVEVFLSRKLFPLSWAVSSSSSSLFFFSLGVLKLTFDKLKYPYVYIGF